ncbi:ATP-binding protein [Pseudoroseomonas rhizosphaerae]|uniref:ATP-binding protein n=1 Tax=Teichococcus rhizosphaerae TaxID=1335062 RepID=A0A2C7A792_9PROT|nr:ATP-binding protein [Pseudoroseomonas rhizosphaerae]PHK93205.1 ATP-binding protein [Pseudoroseomonas rhizosphaerae]
MNTLVTKLKVSDEDFLIASLIERCPKVMMLRELVQNALEAASMAPAGQRSVEITTTMVEGARKLVICNTGPGMSGAALHQMCDIASSIGKLKGLEGNFGMGAKVASLPSNTLGIRYRSCSGGRVHEVTIGKRNGVYGRIWRRAPGSSSLPGMERMVDVAEVTALVRDEGLPLDHDWTEVVLLGNRPEQDTAAEPFDGDPAVPKDWICAGLYGRFFRIVGGITITIAPDLQPHPEPQRFATLMERASTAFERYETVRTENGIVIHYLYDPPHPEKPWLNTSSIGALQPTASGGAVVHRDEIYASVSGSPWAYNGPLYGITFGARHTSIYVELPNSYPVIVDGYRQFLRYKTGAQDIVALADFAALIRANCPAWLQQKIRPASQAQPGSFDVQKEMEELRARLGFKTEGEAALALPTLVPLRDEEDIRHRWLLNRAGCYYPETNELLVNLTYHSVALLQAELEKAFKDYADSAPLAAWTREVAELVLVRRVARALLFALTKRDQKDTWHEGHIEKAMAPESLSIVADDTLESLPWAWNLLNKRIKAAKP